MNSITAKTKCTDSKTHINLIHIKQHLKKMLSCQINTRKTTKKNN
jgi:hypothetical protein